MQELWPKSVAPLSMYQKERAGHTLKGMGAELAKDQGWNRAGVRARYLQDGSTEPNSDHARGQNEQSGLRKRAACTNVTSTLPTVFGTGDGKVAVETPVSGCREHVACCSIHLASVR